MKKNIIITTAAFIALSASIFSCNKKANDADETTITEQAAEVQARTEYIDQEANDVVEESAAKTGSWAPAGCNPTFNNWATGCATVTTTGAFPNKLITVDFGTGCTNAKGITRSGLINISLTDHLNNPGSVATITFTNFYRNGFKRDGTITRTNTTVVGGNPTYNRTVVNGTLTNPAGVTRTVNSNLNLEQTAGMSTPCDRTDDTHLITGTRSVVGFNGKSRTTTTQTPLQKKGNCANIDQGILLVVNGNGKTGTLDFGNGNCDNQAILTIAGKSPKTITLK